MEKVNNKICILDCTLRDGSYLIDYQFSIEDTYLIATALSKAGIEYIEVGHGQGLDAQYKGKGNAAESDLQYIEAAASAVNKCSKIGVFFIPGIGNIKSIKKAKDNGLDFIRIGTNVNELENAQEAIYVAKSLNLEVWSNLMKSYVVNPDKFAECVLQASKYGADIITLVDSAGGMTPNEIRKYVKASRQVFAGGLGFHGHNNLQLAIANCIAGLEEGVCYFDASLRGIGRSAGNAPLEVLCALLCREDVDIGPIDWKQLIRFADEFISPMMPRDTGLLPIEIASGISYFHSSFQNIIDASSKKYDVSSYKIILNIGENGRTGISQTMSDHAAENVLSTKLSEKKQFTYNSRWMNRCSCDTIDDLVRNLSMLSAKSGYKSVLTIARTRRQNPAPIRIAPIRVGNKFCIGHIESSSEIEDVKILNTIGKKIKLWMIDRNIKIPEKLPEDFIVIPYNDDLLILKALCDFVRLNTKIKSVYLPENNDIISNLASKLINLFCPVVNENADAGIALNSLKKFTFDDVGYIKKSGLLIVAQMCSVSQEIIDYTRKCGLTLFRLDLTDTLISEVSRIFNYHHRKVNHTGKLDVQGITVIAGGEIGKKNDIIVNSISTPTMILGKADGLGGVEPLAANDEDVRLLIMNWIFSKMMM